MSVGPARAFSVDSGWGTLAAMRIVPVESLQQFAAVQLLSDPGHIAGPVVIPNAMRIRLNWTLGNGKVAHNILYAQWTGSPTISTSLADTVKNGLVNGGTWTTLAAFLVTTASLTSVTLQDARTAVAAEFTSTVAATPGTGAGPQMPDEVAAVVTLRTGNRGPSGRGRIYIPGWITTGTIGAGGVIAATVVTALQNWATTNLKGTIDSTVGPLSLGLPGRAAYTSDRTGRQFPARAATTVTVTSCQVRNNTWDSQRRRGLR